MDHAGIRTRGLTIESRWAWLAVRVGALGFAVSSAACDYFPNYVITSVGLVDTTRQSVNVQIFRPPQPLPCTEALRSDAESMLGAESFALESCSVIEPFVLNALDTDAVPYNQGATQTPPPSPHPHRECDAVLLRADGLDDTVILWHDVPQARISSDYDPPLDSPNIAYLNNIGEKRFILPPAVATTWVAGFTLESADCAALP